MRCKVKTITDILSAFPRDVSKYTWVESNMRVLAHRIFNRYQRPWRPCQQESWLLSIKYSLSQNSHTTFYSRARALARCHTPGPSVTCEFCGALDRFALEMRFRSRLPLLRVSSICTQHVVIAIVRIFSF